MKKVFGRQSRSRYNQSTHGINDSAEYRVMSDELRTHSLAKPFEMLNFKRTRTRTTLLLSTQHSVLGTKNDEYSANFTRKRSRPADRSGGGLGRQARETATTSPRGSTRISRAMLDPERAERVWDALERHRTRRAANADQHQGQDARSQVRARLRLDPAHGRGGDRARTAARSTRKQPPKGCTIAG